MVPTDTTQQSTDSATDAPLHSPDVRDNTLEDYAGIAAAVALILQPMIRETVEVAMKAGLDKLCNELYTQTARIGEAEQQILTTEDGLQLQKVQITKLDPYMQTDLKNRSRHNNLRIVGLPEAYKMEDLLQLCAVEIPRALGIKKQTDVERGRNPQADRRGPQKVILKYMNYMDKATILQTFRSERSLQIEGTDLLIFADYSAELTTKKKIFSLVCMQLFHKHVKFTLAYPATLYLQTPDSTQILFQNPV